MYWRSRWMWMYEYVCIKVFLFIFLSLLFFFQAESAVLTASSHSQPHDALGWRNADRRAERKKWKKKKMSEWGTVRWVNLLKFHHFLFFLSPSTIFSLYLPPSDYLPPSLSAFPAGEPFIKFINSLYRYFRLIIKRNPVFKEINKKDALLPFISSWVNGIGIISDSPDNDREKKVRIKRWNKKNNLHLLFRWF